MVKADRQLSLLSVEIKTFASITRTVSALPVSDIVTARRRELHEGNDRRCDREGLGLRGIYQAI